MRPALLVLGLLSSAALCEGRTFSGPSGMPLHLRRPDAQPPLLVRRVLDLRGGAWKAAAVNAKDGSGLAADAGGPACRLPCPPGALGCARVRHSAHVGATARAAPSTSSALCSDRRLALQAQANFSSRPCRARLPRSRTKRGSRRRSSGSSLTASSWTTPRPLGTTTSRRSRPSTLCSGCAAAACRATAVTGANAVFGATAGHPVRGWCSSGVWGSFAGRPRQRIRCRCRPRAPGRFMPAALWAAGCSGGPNVGCHRGALHISPSVEPCRLDLSAASAPARWSWPQWRRCYALTFGTCLVRCIMCSPLAPHPTRFSGLRLLCNIKKLVRLKKPRLPSALGLSGACGVEA
eukprot:scaffold1532_cov120-Isochrysis_galbana.AAC.4